MPKISDLVDADPLVGNEWIPIEQDGQTRRVNTGGFMVPGGGGGDSSVTPLSFYATGGYVVGSGGDDYPALYTALSTLSAAGGGWVSLPATIRLSFGVTVPANVGIVGQRTTVIPTATITTMITVSGGNTHLSDLVFTNPSSLATNAIKITKPRDDSPLLLSDIAVHDYTRGFWSTDGDVINLVRPFAQNCTTAIAIDNGFLNSNILSPYLLNGNGIDVAVPTAQQPEGLRIIGGTILPYLNGDFAIRLRSGLEVGISGVTIDQIAKTAANGIVLDSSGFSVKNIKITDCWFGKNLSATGTGHGVKITGGGTERVGIRGNTFDALDGRGIDADGGAGILIALSITENRFRACTTGDVKLKATRAVLTGNNFTNATHSVEIDSAAYGVHSIVTANDFVGAANPIIGNIAGSQVFGNKGNTNDSLDSTQSVGLNTRAGAVVTTSLDANAGLVGEAAGGTSNAQMSVRAASGNTNGANFRLEGDGSTTPKKTVRAHGGELQIMNDAYSALIMRLSDAGLLTLLGGLAAGGTITGAGGLSLNGSSFGIELGNPVAVNTPYIDGHSSGNNIDYDARLQFSGGSGTVGQGSIAFLTGPGGISGDFSSGAVKPSGGSSLRALSALFVEGGLSVKWFGAVGDGTADDTTAINDTISACVTAGGGIVYFPAGTYRITSTITIASVGVPLRFRGAVNYGAKVFVNSATSIAVFNVGSATADSGMISFEDLHITGSTGAGANLNGNTAINFSNRNNAYINRVWIDNNYTGLSFTASYAPIVTNCLITNCHGYGVAFVDTSANGSVISGTGIYACGTSTTSGAGLAYGAGGEAPLVIGCDFETCWIGVSAVDTVSLNILNSYIELSGAGNLFFSGNNMSTSVRNCWLGQSPTITLASLKMAEFVGNTIYNYSILFGSSCIDITTGNNNFLGTGSMGAPAYTGAGTLSNGWTTTGAPVPGFRKLNNNMVLLKGRLTAGTMNATIFTLPAGYRPAEDLFFVCAASGAATSGTVLIRSSGTVECQFPTGGTIWLDSITFPTS